MPPRSAARSTITEPGFIAATISVVSRIGAGRPGIKAVVITASIWARCSVIACCCLVAWSWFCSLA